MDINPNTVEQMAREYSRSLGTSAAGGDAGVFEQAIILEEEQLDLLNDLNARSSNRLNRTAGYLKNLVYRSLSAISRLNGTSSYIPSVRSSPSVCQTAAAAARLMNLQLDIFILLDRLSLPYADRAELLALENRKAALLASFF